MLTHQCPNLNMTISDNFADAHSWCKQLVGIFSCSLPYINYSHLQNSFVIHVCKAISTMLGWMTRWVVLSINTKLDFLARSFIPGHTSLLLPEIIYRRGNVQTLILIKQCFWKILNVWGRIYGSMSMYFYWCTGFN